VIASSKLIPPIITKEVLGTFGVGVWKHIRRGWDKFSNFVRFEVGIGSHVSF
jgi:hypothetical protein